MELGSSNDVLSRFYVIYKCINVCYAPLLHGALKVNAGIGNLPQGLDVLEVLNYSCEGGIFVRKLGMDFCHNPFGLGSS